jgi:hypothetical protein
VAFLALEIDMSKGKELWDAASMNDVKGGVRSANAMRFYSLATMLAEAETAWLTHDHDRSMELLRQLQNHCQKMIAELESDKPTRPALMVTAA